MLVDPFFVFFVSIDTQDELMQLGRESALKRQRLKRTKADQSKNVHVEHLHDHIITRNERVLEVANMITMREIALEVKEDLRVNADPNKNVHVEHLSGHVTARDFRRTELSKLMLGVREMKQEIRKKKLDKADQSKNEHVDHLADHVFTRDLRLYDTINGGGGRRHENTEETVQCALCDHVVHMFSGLNRFKNLIKHRMDEHPSKTNQDVGVPRIGGPSDTSIVRFTATNNHTGTITTFSNISDAARKLSSIHSTLAYRRCRTGIKDCLAGSRINVRVISIGKRIPNRNDGAMWYTFAHVEE